MALIAEPIELEPTIKPAAKHTLTKAAKVNPTEKANLVIDDYSSL